MPDWTTKIYLPDADATTRLGQRIAPLLGPGDCLLLAGDIGAGKSHFARAIIQARLSAVGRNEDVPSPTFTLVQIYFDDVCEIWHSDLYRLSDISEIYELGLDEAFGYAITLIEWPDRLADTFPKNALHLLFEPTDGEQGRWLTASSANVEWHDTFKTLAKDTH